MDPDAPPIEPPPPPPPPPPPDVPLPPRRRLHRDRANGILGGVCAGVAETFDLDPMLVRALWVVAAFVWIGLPAYVIAWIALPSADGTPARVRSSRDRGALVGLVLVAIGVAVATNHVLPHPLRPDRFGVPVLLIGGGLAILLMRRREPDGTPIARDGQSPATLADTTSVHPAAQPTDATATSGTVPPSAWTQTAPWPAAPSGRSLRRAARLERRAERPRPFLTPVTLSVLLIGAGIASLLQATGALDVNLTVVLAIGTCVVGAALVVAAFAGRAHTLIAVGIVVLAATAASNAIDVPLRGGIGNHEYRPLQRSELSTHYELGIGELDLDLRGLPLTGRTTVVDAQTGIGELLVFVPSSVRVEVRAHAGAGAVQLFGRASGGVPADDQRTVDGSGPGVLRLNLRVGAGQVRVRRFEPGGVETILADSTTGGNG